MKLNEFYKEVAKRADTAGTTISAAETSRVLSEAFLLLNAQSASVAADIVAKGIGTAAKKAAKKPAAQKKTAKKKAAPKKTAKRKTAKKK